MNKELVLFRHGPAEERGFTADFDRKLTPTGIEKTKQAVLGLQKLLNGKTLTLYSSPLVRAVETAEIIAKKLKLSFTQHAWIADGDIYYLRKALEKCENTLVIVGHEPTLSYWHHEFTGEYFEYKKSGAALIQIRDNGSAESLWAHTRKELKKIGKAQNNILK
ncbi:MAG: histidine phosphatase family protein [Treponemataceae bacterium]